VTRLARGGSRSTSIDQVVADINYAVAGGAHEAVLTGVQIGSWGRELQPEARLSSLIGAVLTETKIPRLRISSIEPWEVDDELISLWRDPRLCRHFHLPLQSGSLSVLKRMARKTSRQEFRLLVERIRAAIPNVSITTDVIVGFPGESDAEFDETYAFIRSIGFSGGHVFVYSARPGTPAAGYPNQVLHTVRRQRSKVLRDLFSNQAELFQKQFLGEKLEVLWERSVKTTGGWSSSGLSDNYLRVNAILPGYSWNSISPVCIRNVTTSGLSGEVIDHEG
jgi:threonylcarbamoyladenosine tRNA methylthiotransferase MtaB